MKTADLSHPRTRTTLCKEIKPVRGRKCSSRVLYPIRQRMLSLRRSQFKSGVYQVGQKSWLDCGPGGLDLGTPALKTTKSTFASAKWKRVIILLFPSSAKHTDYM